MFIHTHENVSELFHNFSGRLQELGPVCLVGPSGLGKLFYITEYIRHIECSGGYTPFYRIPDFYIDKCPCRECGDIINNCANDVMILESCNSIEEMRNKLNEFVDSQAVEFKFKYLVVRNLHLFTNNELDVLLNVFEEPPKHIKIFTTAVDLSWVSNPIKSRLQCFEVVPFSKDILKYLVESVPELLPYLNSLDKFSFTTIDQLIYYNKFSFEGVFEQLFSKADTSYGIASTLDKFLNLIKDQAGHLESDVLSFFLEFCVIRLNDYIRLNPDNENVKYFGDFLSNNVFPLYSNSLFKYINFRRQHYVDIVNQLYLFFDTIYLLRKIVGV